MPGKVNPVMPEVVNQVAFQVIGNDHTICLACEAGQFELNVMGPVLAFNLLQSLKILRNAADVFERFAIEGLRSRPRTLQDLRRAKLRYRHSLKPASRLRSRRAVSERSCAHWHDAQRAHPGARASYT